MDETEEKIRVLLFALEELKLQLLRSDSPLYRAEYNVVVGKINSLNKEYEKRKMEENKGNEIMNQLMKDPLIQQVIKQKLTELKLN